MRYKALLGVLAVLSFIALAALNVPGSLEAAGQAQSVNSPPEFDDDDHREVQVDENSGEGANIGDPVTATDLENDPLCYWLYAEDNAFRVNSSTGQIRANKDFDYETRPEYRGYLYVSDDQINGNCVETMDDYIEIVVEVQNVDEPGTVLMYWDHPQVNTVQKASLTDEDGEVSGVTWTWARSMDKSSWTNITTADTYTPVAADLNYYLRATASYTDAEGPNKTAEVVSDNVVRERPADADNSAPTFSDTTTTRLVKENSPPGTEFGTPVTATDPNTGDGDEIRYSVEGTDEASFDIDPRTGKLRTGEVSLDHEGEKPSYSITVKVTDHSGLTDTIAVTIEVTDVNERPKVSGNLKPEYAENSATLLVTTLTGEDEDVGDEFPQNAYVSWLIGGYGGSDGDFFYLDDNRDEVDIKFRVPPDFDNPADSNGDNVYDISMTAYSGKYDQTFFNVKVTVTDGNDQGVVVGPSSVDYPERATRAVATYTISDTSQQTITWSLTGTDRDQFSISGGVLNFVSPPDHDSPVDKDQNNVYSITVTASNANLTAAVNVLVTVTEHSYPPVVSGPTTPTFAENDTGTVATYSATDGDNDSITWSPGGTDGSYFDISNTGELTFKSPPDFEARADNTYEVTVQAYDGTNRVDYPVTVTVTNVNEAPTFPAGPHSRSVDENTEADQEIGLPIEATDVDANDSLTYSFGGGTDDTSFDIVTTTGQLKTKAALDYETKSSYSVTVKARDAEGLNADIVVNIDVGDVNDAPAFDAETADRDIAENTVAATNIGDAFQATDQDPGDTTLTYSLDATSAVVFDIDATTGQLKTKAALDHETTPSYTITLVATDSSDSTDSILVTVAITDVNEAPEFPSAEDGNRGVPENTPTGQPIGGPVAAIDPDAGATLTYALGGDDVASFGFDTSTGQIRTKDALVKANQDTYSVTVSVRDSKDDAGEADTTVDDTIDVTITVRDANSEPAFAIGATDTREIAEDTAANTNIGDPVAATDLDGDTLTYTLGGTDAASFNFDASTGQFKTKVPLDHETTPSYEVTVSVSDSKASNGDADPGDADPVVDDTITVTINVTDVDEDGAVKLFPRQPQVGTEFTAKLSDPDVDSTTTITWAWEKSTDKTTWATISTATAAVYTPAAADETNYLRVTATYDDGHGSKTEEAVSEFQVRAAPAADTNTAPTFAAETTIRSVVEGADPNRNVGAPVAATDADSIDANLLTYTLDGVDAKSFSIVESSGQIKTKVALVHADKAAYTVTVTATDPSLEAATITVNINVTRYVAPQRTRGSGGGGVSSAPAKPVNPEPEFDARGPVTITVAENTEAGTDIGDPLTASDDDDTVLTYSIVDWKDGSSFDIDSSTGQLKTKAALDYETRTQYQLQGKVHDDDGGDDRITVNIRVTGVPEAPTVTGDATIEVAENSRGRLAQYSATDPEGQTITWDLSGDDAGDFSIANGRLSFASTPDHENPADDDGDNVYNVTVEASDGTDTGTLDVTVTVTSLVDDFRVQTSTRGSDTTGGSGTGGFGSGSGSGSGTGMTSMSYPENSTATVATYAVVEPSGNAIAWSAGGDDGSLFSVVGGALSFISPPDYEFPADTDENNSYVVKVQASDGTETASLDITINVTNVNEAPSVTGETALSYDEQGTGSVATYTGSDPEGDALTWSVSGDDSDAFDIEAGVLSFRDKPDYEEPSDADADNVYDVTVSVSDGTYSDSVSASVTVADIQEVPITNADTQAVALVRTDGEITIMTPDDVASVTFPTASRDKAYFVRVDSDVDNCDNDSSENELQVCLTVEIFDTWGVREEDVTLEEAASISLMMDADDLGGAEVVLEAYELDGINIYTRSSSDDEWSEVEFTLRASSEEGLVTITVTGVTSFSSFATTTNVAVFQQLLSPPTPIPTPTPTPEPRPRSDPSSMMVGPSMLRLPPRPPSASVRPSKLDSEDLLDGMDPGIHAGPLIPGVDGTVEKAAIWALIVLILGSIMFASGSGMIAWPRITAPPPWMRVPGAEVKPAKKAKVRKPKI